MNPNAQPACAQPGVDPDIFFSADPDTEAAAIDLCRTCPVRQPCLDYALPRGVQGVWGGTTADQRRERRRAQKLVPQAVTAAVDERPAWQRVVDMHAEGMKPREIADALGITYNSATTYISRYVHRGWAGKGAKQPKPIEHGTTRGYNMHRARGVPIDDDDTCGCRAAAVGYNREKRAARRQAS